ncbi:MAG: NAD-dependent epimerase/dehydratase family protein [Caulobacteraceae bacterium]|nr:NAD-dependent epimerase/dehydratase family protein [Caulobacter sp.]
MTDAAAAAPPILVLGATSLIGRRLPHAAAGRPLAGVSRARRDGGGYHWAQADLAYPAADLPRAAEALALCPIWLLPDAFGALERAGVRRLVAVSSTSRWTKAASPHAAEREVARRLAQGEAALQAWAAERAIGWTVLRPTLIYDEGRDRNVSRLAALARRFGALPLAGAGRGLRQPVHAADLARGALDALASPAAAGRAYDLPGGETLSYRAMCVRVFEGLGRRPRLVPLPPPLWRAALALASPWLPGATAAMGGRMSEDLAFDPAPARRDFAWRPRPFRPDFLAPPPA